MPGPRLLVPDAEHPEKLYVSPDFVLLTEDILNGPDRWTRFVQSTYIPRRGTLSSRGERRINLHAYFYDEGTGRYLPFFDDEWVAEEFNRYHINGTLTAIHYAPGVRVMSFLVGLPLDTEENLPEQMKRLLPRPENHYN